MFGLRLQRHSFDFFAEKLAVLHPECANDSQRLQAAFGHTCIIHLARQDKVEQAVSYVKAEQTGLWHAAPDGTELERLSPPREPSYEPDKIAASFKDLTAYDHQWESWFKAESLDPFLHHIGRAVCRPNWDVKQNLGSIGTGPPSGKGG